jgi:hypothetical protein
MSLGSLFDLFFSVDEFDTGYDLCDQFRAIEPAPVLLGFHGEFEDHGQCRDSRAGVDSMGLVVRRTLMGPIPLTISRSGRCPLRTTSRCPFSSRRFLWNSMSVHYLVFDRCLQQLARSFLEQLFEKWFLSIFSSLIERDHFIFRHWRILSFFGVLG